MSIGVNRDNANLIDKIVKSTFGVVNGHTPGTECHRGRMQQRTVLNVCCSYLLLFIYLQATAGVLS